MGQIVGARNTVPCEGLEVSRFIHLSAPENIRDTTQPPRTPRSIRTVDSPTMTNAHSHVWVRQQYSPPLEYA